ncbi:hypothetical protein IFO70_33820 [Phormidium tenue FACHB-886]|nr:hypothetical protein [Phormidium tenue FACHB-886]
MQADPQAATNVERAIAAVEDWYPAGRRDLKPQYIQKAWQRFHEQRSVLAAGPA